MKLCEICGNPIPENSRQCPYCQQLQSGEKKGHPGESIRTINLEAGKPTVEEALIRLERELNFAKSAGVLLIRIIHGYGSSGVGGDIRNACQRYLREAYQKGNIKRFIPGELLRISTKQGHVILTRYPELKNDKKNRGITIIEL
ncbi:Smr/MutS family protein [Fidelibacter multiformis]|uniref:Smr/MutS family protein n=1 Tax=Fidelibacter multiformis TaxID=3377529 RepID=UPI0037DC955B